jgi:hypothetical protein
VFLNTDARRCVSDLPDEGELEDNQRQLLTVGKKSASTGRFSGYVLIFVRLGATRAKQRVVRLNPVQGTLIFFQPVALVCR